MDRLPLDGVGLVEWAVRGRPIAGERESGDLHVVEPFEDGVLIGLIDGLGHGREAAIASRAAVASIRENPARQLPDIFQACHEALQGLRGAVVSLASIAASRAVMSWMGIGNVEALLVRSDGDIARRPHRERINLRSGVVGYQLPTLRATDVALYPGDMLIFVSDGIRYAFSDEPPARLSSADYAEYLLKAYGKDSDDATVLVAQYKGAVA